MQLVHRGSKMLLDQSCSNSIVQCKHWILCVSISISKWNEKLGQMLSGSQLEKSLILQILSLGWTTKLMILLPSNPKQPGNGGSGKQPYWCQNAHHRLKYLKQKEPSTTFMCLLCSLFHHVMLLKLVHLQNIWGWENEMKWIRLIFGC